ncbi:hypothetical protein [Burkholderia alba]|uniref:hypothetical protein n=1 Tax=Burkholderia alba TaxID=2683677 RepID=UPI002B061814|nr:hypothetical protein [Burkholderia alba]
MSQTGHPMTCVCCGNQTHADTARTSWLRTDLIRAIGICTRCSVGVSHWDAGRVYSTYDVPSWEWTCDVSVGIASTVDYQAGQASGKRAWWQSHPPIARGRGESSGQPAHIDPELARQCGIAAGWRDAWRSAAVLKSYALGGRAWRWAWVHNQLATNPFIDSAVVDEGRHLRVFAWGGGLGHMKETMSRVVSRDSKATRELYVNAYCEHYRQGTETAFIHDMCDARETVWQLFTAPRTFARWAANAGWWDGLIDATTRTSYGLYHRAFVDISWIRLEEETLSDDLISDLPRDVVVSVKQDDGSSTFVVPNGHDPFSPF